MRRVIDEDTQAIAAARAVLGISFGELGTAVAQHWQFAPAMINALAPLPEGPLPAATDADGRMWQCVGYARELCALARISNAETREKAFAVHLERFAPTIRVVDHAVRELMAHSVELARSYAASAGLTVDDTPMLAGMRALSGTTPPVLQVAAGAATPPVAANDAPTQLSAPTSLGSRLAQALRARL